MVQKPRTDIRTDRQTDRHSWFHSKCTIKRSKGPVDIKFTKFGEQISICQTPNCENVGQSSPKFFRWCYSSKPLTMQNFVAIGNKMPEIFAIKNLCSPKKCLSGPSYGLLDRGGDKNWSIWWPACPGSVWKYLSLTKFVKWAEITDIRTDRQTDKQADRHSWFHSKCTLKRSKGPVDMK